MRPTAAWDGIPEFGKQVPSRHYVPRPGAYAILCDPVGRVAVVRTSRGCFLPGGGLEPGEAPEEGLRREVREECGYEVGDLLPLGGAVQYVFSPGHDHGYRKMGAFFTGTMTDPSDPSVACQREADHELLWLSPREAMNCLVHESQVWALRQALTRGQKSEI